MRILFNANIVTNDPTHPRVSALAIAHGRIIMAGSDQEVLNEFDGKGVKEDMHGRTIWPGLTDAHLHLEHYASALQMVDCETDTQAECLRRVAERAKQTPAGSWVRGHGWNQHSWPEGFGTIQQLDAISPDKPIYLTAKSLHASWANSAALRAAGISANTPDPTGGVIGRDEKGSLNGLLFETAMDLIHGAIPAMSIEQLAASLEESQRNLWKVGVTGVHDYDRRACFSALQILHQRQALKLRVTKGIPLEDMAHAAALGLRTGFGDDYLRIGSVKMFADGALGPRTAAMIQPYEGESEETGILLMDNEEIFEHSQQAAANGMSVAIHAIGDRANHEVLQAYAQLRKFEQENHLPVLRHRIEHVQILHPDDYHRLADLNVIASVQPIHATSDMYAADRHWGKRSEGAYAFRTLLKNGTHLCFGSDAPVELPNPFLGLHAAVTRQRPDGSPGNDGWYPEQRLSLEEALLGYTTGPAFAAGQEHKQGRLSQNYLADLIVLDEDPFAIPSQELYRILPSATMVGGEWVWQVE